MSGPQLDKAMWGGEWRFDALLDDIRKRRGEFEAQHHVSADIVEQFKEIGIYRAFVPKDFGGDERSPVEFLTAIEAISAADGSAGWVASFGMCEAYLAGLPLDKVQETWAEPDAVFAGAMFPLQPAEVVDGGYRLNGRWKWASGCMSADRIGVGIQPDEPGALPRMAVLPADQVIIEPGSWDTHGMTGSGSYDVSVTDVVVDADWTFVRGGPKTAEGPYFRYPTITIAAQVLAVCSLGVARTALDIIQEMGASGHTSRTGGAGLGEKEFARISIAKAEAKWRAARLFFYDPIERAWDLLLAGEELDTELRSELRLATTHVTRECAEVAQLAYHLGGLESAEMANHLSRCWRDVHLPTQHAFMGEMTYAQAGAVLFGHAPGPGYL